MTMSHQLDDSLCDDLFGAPDPNSIEFAAGVDEAGRGPLAGPVYAAAVILDPARPIEGLRDNRVPILFIHGAEDKFIPPAHSDERRAVADETRTVTAPESPSTTSSPACGGVAPFTPSVQFAASSQGDASRADAAHRHRDARQVGTVVMAHPCAAEERFGRQESGKCSHGLVLCSIRIMVAAAPRIILQ